MLLISVVESYGVISELQIGHFHPLLTSSTHFEAYDEAPLPSSSHNLIKSLHFQYEKERAKRVTDL